MVAFTGNAPARIFLSYRREETAYPAAWLFDRLAGHFGAGQVFKDVDSIELGDDFVDVINTAVGYCDVLLALIGSRWITVTDANGRRRLDDPADFVRLEIEAALERDVRVIPILVDGARMPATHELPASLARLARRQALELTPSRFTADSGKLMRALDRAIAEAQQQASQETLRTPAQVPPSAAEAPGPPDQAPAPADDQPPADDKPSAPATAVSEPDPVQIMPEAPRPARRGFRRRPAIVAIAGAGIATAGLIIALTVIPGAPQAPRVRRPATPSTSAPPAITKTSARWTYPTGSPVITKVAVAGGRVYVDANSEIDAMDAASGHLQWSYPAGFVIRSGPAVAGGIVYTGDEDGKVIALDAVTGHFRWSFSTGGFIESIPAVAGGTVYVGSEDHKVYALDAATGHLRWSYLAGEDVDSSPAVAGGTVYVGCQDRKVYALDAATGHLRWSYATGGEVDSSPAVANGFVYIGSDDTRLYALRA